MCNIDCGKALKEILFAQETFFKENFMSSFMLVGCVILGMHFEQPNTAKWTALGCALSVLGRGEMPLRGKNMFLSVHVVV